MEEYTCTPSLILHSASWDTLGFPRHSKFPENFGFAEIFRISQNISGLPRGSRYFRHVQKIWSLTRVLQVSQGLSRIFSFSRPLFSEDFEFSEIFREFDSPENFGYPNTYSDFPPRHFKFLEKFLFPKNFDSLEIFLAIPRYFDFRTHFRKFWFLPRTSSSPTHPRVSSFSRSMPMFPKTFRISRKHRSTMRYFALFPKTIQVSWGYFVPKEFRFSRDVSRCSQNISRSPWILNFQRHARKC